MNNILKKIKKTMIIHSEAICAITTAFQIILTIITIAWCNKKW